MPWVRDYVRSDGTPVRGHSRWAPGARRELTVLAVIALAVVGMGGGGGGASGGGSAPRPQSTVRYPVKFENTTTVKHRPQPTVSYPIPWERSDGDR
ncbi:hypothetical protein DC008_35145 [Streptomyces nigra]|nr:hypothetical protein DC008_35145 [Streptomyces nigra]